MKKKLWIASVVLNIFLLGIMCFGAYYKRSAIISYITRFYDSLFTENEPFENVLLEFNQSPYQTDIQYKNENLYEKKIKLVILGNSISLHGIDELWEYEAGMAASDIEHDYVHVLVNKVSEEKACGIEYIVINIADFERTFENYDISRLEKIKEFKPDIVIFQIGENTSTEKLITKGKVFVDNYKNLIEYCNGKETIVCLPFWPVKEKNNLITDVALEAEVHLVDLSHLGSGIDSLNFASSEKNYSHAGVGAHPGNYGMEKIAEMLYITINKIME